MKKFFLFALISVLFWTCSKNPAEQSDPSDNIYQEKITDKMISDFQQANMFFSHKIYKEIVSQDTVNANLMISPLSISIALSMLNNGAAESTKDQIKSVLEYQNLTDFCINTGFKNLITQLNFYRDVADIDIANSEWFDVNFPVKETFVQVNKDFYNAEVRNLDFSDPGSVDSINAWVNDKTDGKITEIIDLIDPEAVFYLINAINFQGFWKFPFDIDNTVNAKFYSEDMTYKYVQTMKAFVSSESPDSPVKEFSFLYTDDFKAVKMPYGKDMPLEYSTKTSSIPVSKDNINMYIFVPTGDLKPFVESQLNGDNWNTWMNSFQPYEELYPYSYSDFEFSLPKFKFGCDKNLIPVLQALGMSDSFTAGVANFSGITELWQGLFINLVKHKSYIEVNEEGTSAAAVTIIGGGYGVPNVFKANKPFLFAVRDDLTGTILFMGQVYDPQY